MKSIMKKLLLKRSYRNVKQRYLKELSTAIWESRTSNKPTRQKAKHTKTMGLMSLVLLLHKAHPHQKTKQIKRNKVKHQ